MAEIHWIRPSIRLPADGEEVLAVVSGSHGGYRYDHDVVNAIYDHGSWYLDDGVVDGEEQTIIVSDWMPMPEAVLRDAPRMLDGTELLNRLTLISATAGQWSGPRVIQEVIGEVRQMMRQTGA